MKRNRHFLLGWFFLFSMFGSQVCHGQNNVVTLSQIIAAQKGYSNDIRSFAAKYQDQNQALLSKSKDAVAAGVAGAKVQKRSVFYAVKGIKYLEQSKRISINGTPLTDNGLAPSLMVYDGKHNHMVTNMQVVSGKIVPEGDDQTRDTMTNRAERPLPNPLDFGYRDETYWIGDVLSIGQFKVDGTEQDAQFGPLIRVEGQYYDQQEKLNQQVSFWFAQNFGFLSVRTVVGDAQTKTIYQVDQLKNVHGLWFAVAAHRDMAYTGPTFSLHSDANQFAHYSLLVSNVQVNMVPDSLFNVKLTPGGQLYDEDGYVVYKIGPSGERIVNHAFDAVLRGDPYARTKGWLFVASLTSILLLGLGAFVKWRRRNASA